MAARSRGDCRKVSRLGGTCARLGSLERCDRDDQGLLLVAAGKDVVRFVPPLLLLHTRNGQRRCNVLKQQFKK